MLLLCRWHMCLKDLPFDLTCKIVKTMAHVDDGFAEGGDLQLRLQVARLLRTLRDKQLEELDGAGFRALEAGAIGRAVSAAFVAEVVAFAKDPLQHPLTRGALARCSVLAHMVYALVAPHAAAMAARLAHMKRMEARRRSSAAAAAAASQPAADDVRTVTKIQMLEQQLEELRKALELQRMITELNAAAGRTGDAAAPPPVAATRDAAKEVPGASRGSSSSSSSGVGGSARPDMTSILAAAKDKKLRRLSAAGDPTKGPQPSAASSSSLRGGAAAAAAAAGRTAATTRAGAAAAGGGGGANLQGLLKSALEQRFRRNAAEGPGTPARHAAPSSPAPVGTSPADSEGSASVWDSPRAAAAVLPSLQQLDGRPGGSCAAASRTALLVRKASDLRLRRKSSAAAMAAAAASMTAAAAAAVVPPAGSALPASLALLARRNVRNSRRSSVFSSFSQDSDDNGDDGGSQRSQPQHVGGSSPAPPVLRRAVSFSDTVDVYTLGDDDDDEVVVVEAEAEGASAAWEGGGSSRVDGGGAPASASMSSSSVPLPAQSHPGAPPRLPPPAAAPAATAARPPPGGMLSEIKNFNVRALRQAALDDRGVGENGGEGTPAYKRASEPAGGPTSFASAIQGFNRDSLRKAAPAAPKTAEVAAAAGSPAPAQRAHPGAARAGVPPLPARFTPGDALKVQLRKTNKALP